MIFLLLITCLIGDEYGSPIFIMTYGLPGSKVLRNLLLIPMLLTFFIGFIYVPFIKVSHVFVKIIQRKFRSSNMSLEVFMLRLDMFIVHFNSFFELKSTLKFIMINSISLISIDKINYLLY